MCREDTGTVNSIGPRTSSRNLVCVISIVCVLLLAIVALSSLHEAVKKAAAGYVQAAVEEIDIPTRVSESLSKALSDEDIGGRVDQAISDNNIEGRVQGTIWDSVIEETVRRKVKPVVQDVLREWYEEASAVPAPESGPAETPSEVEK